MSTVDHLIAACGSLRTAWGWLATTVEPGRTRRNQRHVTEQAQAQRNQRAVEDWAGRHLMMNGGKVITGHAGAPANLTAIETREQIAHDVDDTAWVMASAMRQLKYATNYRPNGASADTRFRTGVDWISLNAPRLHDRSIINGTYRALNDANTLARAVVGEGPQRRSLAGECPACGRRSLAWDTSSTDSREWHVMCTRADCRCDGRDCNCHLPERQHGMTHVWLESMWNRLAEQLNRAGGER